VGKSRREEEAKLEKIHQICSDFIANGYIWYYADSAQQIQAW